MRGTRYRIVVVSSRSLPSRLFAVHQRRGSAPRSTDAYTHRSLTIRQRAQHVTRHAAASNCEALPRNRQRWCVAIELARREREALSVGQTTGSSRKPTKEVCASVEYAGPEETPTRLHLRRDARPFRGASLQHFGRVLIADSAEHEGVTTVRRGCCEPALFVRVGDVRPRSAGQIERFAASQKCVVIVLAANREQTILHAYYGALTITTQAGRHYIVVMCVTSPCA
jgi:hypothetical protein